MFGASTQNIPVGSTLGHLDPRPRGVLTWCSASYQRSVHSPFVAPFTGMASGPPDPELGPVRGSRLARVSPKIGSDLTEDDALPLPLPYHLPSLSETPKETPKVPEDRDT